MILAHSLAAPERRLVELIGLGAVSGVFALTAAWAWSERFAVGRQEPTAVATAAMLVMGYLGVAGGASYWAHYLIGLVPALALASGSLAARVTKSIDRVVLALVVLSTVLATAVMGTTDRMAPSARTTAAVSLILRVARTPGDSGIVSFGHANVIQETGLRPGYRYLWSLPMRTLDPQLSFLLATLSGPEAPTWVVKWDPLDSWQIDPHGTLQSVLANRYRPVANVCGVAIYLRDGAERAIAPMRDPCHGRNPASKP